MLVFELVVSGKEFRAAQYTWPGDLINGSVATLPPLEVAGRVDGGARGCVRQRATMCLLATLAGDVPLRAATAAELLPVERVLEVKQHDACSLPPRISNDELKAACAASPQHLVQGDYQERVWSGDNSRLVAEITIDGATLQGEAVFGSSSYARRLSSLGHLFAVGCALRPALNTTGEYAADHLVSVGADIVATFNALGVVYVTGDNSGVPNRDGASLFDGLERMSRLHGWWTCAETAP